MANVEIENDYDSEEERYQNLTEKERREIERRRRKNKKKKESKKKQRENSEAEREPPSEEVADVAEPVNGTVQNGVKDSGISDADSAPVTAIQTDAEEDLAVEIEYVPEEPKVDEDDPTSKYFAQIFEAFKVCYIVVRVV